jgi:hypothetical protein
MISLKSFVDAVHDAIVAANDTLTDSSVGIIAKFFKKITSGNETEDVGSSHLEADSIILKYPHITEKGVEEVDVNVPLLTLAPLTCPTIDTVEFETRFEMEIIDNELQLDFSKENKDTVDVKSNRSGHLKIVISPQEIPEGLKSVIEGYERVLKSQIP